MFCHSKTSIFLGAVLVQKFRNIESTQLKEAKYRHKCLQAQKM